jgi:Tfp pilus assembly protein PilV
MNGQWSAKGAAARSSILGFTLSEVVVSTLIVAVGLVALLSAFLSGLLLVESGRNMAVASADARTVFEEMRRLSSASLLQVTSPATPWSTWARQQGLTTLSNEAITEEFWVAKTNQGSRINRTNPPGLVEASLTVSWSEKGRNRSAQFTSLLTKR